VLLVDRRNHHLFQPLLYQVATAALSAAEIASPLRQVLQHQANATVVMAEAVGLEVRERRLLIEIDGEAPHRVDYDYLVVATGVRHSYFGHPEYERFAPGLKTLEDATSLRSRILGVLERSEAAAILPMSLERLTLVLVGAGPTGVEMAGALAELTRRTLAGEFRRFDPQHVRIVLVEAGPRILPTFDTDLARRARSRLESMGVEIRVAAPVDSVDDRGVLTAGERIEADAVIWTAGVAAPSVASWIDAETDRVGRIRVAQDLSVPGHPEIFVIGDLASHSQDGRLLPGVAQVALQGGRYVARVIESRELGRRSPDPFRYRDLGNLAVVGRNFALFERGRVRLAGWLPWLLWATLHLGQLALFNNRLLVFSQWVWSYFTWQRGSRLIH
jgi:NADH dehydrogenase FAD-containing subunit